MPDNNQNNPIHEHHTDGGVRPPEPEAASCPVDIGDIVGLCRLVSILGQGGMGKVFKAWHLNLLDWRAIKIQLGGASQQESVEEARFQTKLKHPNIVQIHDMAIDPTYNVCFICMEYVDGGSVGSRIREARKDGDTAYSEKEALEIVKAVAKTLSQIKFDGKPVVHRDIKPDNIMLTKDGVVKVGDWGIATLEGAHAENLGTPAYMAPELTRNTPVPPCQLADIYALGVTLYEMLAGEKPFKGKAYEEIWKQAREASRPDIRALRPEISRQTAKLIMDMMAISAKKRPSSWNVVCRRIQTNLEVLVNPSGLFEQFAEWMKSLPGHLRTRLDELFTYKRRKLLKRRMLIGGLAVLFIGACVLTAFSLVGDGNPYKEQMRVCIKKKWSDRNITICFPLVWNHHGNSADWYSRRNATIGWTKSS